MKRGGKRLSARKGGVPPRGVKSRLEKEDRESRDWEEGAKDRALTCYAKGEKITILEREKGGTYSEGEKKEAPLPTGKGKV